MRYYSKRYSVLLNVPPVTVFNINPTRIVHLLNSLGSILARSHFRSAHIATSTTKNVRILPDTHLYTWVESRNLNTISCWRTTVPGIGGVWTRTLTVRVTHTHHYTTPPSYLSGWVGGSNELGQEVPLRFADGGDQTGSRDLLVFCSCLKRKKLRKKIHQCMSVSNHLSSYLSACLLSIHIYLSVY